MKTLFPLIVPNSLPAFNKSLFASYYFKPSIANSMEQINHIQLTIVRQDTNRSVLNSKEYPFDIVFFKKNQIEYNEKKGFYYVSLNPKWFPTADVPYKLQIRAGEEDITPYNTTEKLGTWLKKPETLNKLSEWSIVTMAMPITPPTFELQGLLESNPENPITSTGHTFIGNYMAKDKDKKETLRSYVINAYRYTDPNDRKTWFLKGSSGEKFTGQYENQEIQHTFDFEMTEGDKYMISFSVKTKNLFTDTKFYPIKVQSYPILEMFNSLTATKNEELAQMDLVVKAKQILLKPKNATITYIKDEPGHLAHPNLKGTHAIIKGTIEALNGIELNAEKGRWICQTKVIFNGFHESLKDLSNKPTIMLYSGKGGYETKVKIGIVKINLAYPTNTNLSPNPQWEYRVVVRKELYVNGKFINAQNRIEKTTTSPEGQEYYIYTKENNGLLDVEVAKTYISTAPRRK